MKIKCINKNPSANHSYMSWHTVSGLCNNCSTAMDKKDWVKKLRMADNGFIPHFKKDVTLQENKKYENQ